MKITITNAYTYENKGDAAILLGTIDVLKKIYGNNIEINILSFTKNLDKEKYSFCKNIKNVESNILNPRPYKHTKLGKLLAITKLFNRLIYLLIMFKFNKTKIINKEPSFKLLNESDTILICGGGFLGGKKKHSILHLVQIYFNTKFNKKVYMMSTSIEPFKDKILEKATINILKKVDYIYAREEITYNLLKKYITNVKLVPDMAFMMKKKSYNSPILNKYKTKYNNMIGITLRDWNFPDSKDIKQSMNNYLLCMKEVIEKLSNKNTCFVFIPQVIVSHANDLSVAHKLKNMLSEKKKNNFLIIEEDLTPNLIKGLINEMDYFIGTRMHSNIFSLSNYIPTIAIAYEEKTNGIMNLLNQEKYIIDINNIKSIDVIKKYKQLIKNQTQIKKELKINIKKIENDIIKNMIELFKVDD